MKIRKRVTALFMVLNLFLGLLLPATNVFSMENNKSSSENEACVYGITTTLSDDKQTADVQVTIQPKDNITVYSSILPNGEEREFNTNVIEFQMTENGNFSLGINYKLAEDTEMKKVEIPIEIAGIETSSEKKTDTQSNDVDANEETTKKEGKQDVGVIRNFDLSSVKRTSTGTAPFDGDDNPGNDSTKDNNIVRSFDSIQYDMTYTGEVNTTVGQADLEFELSLNVSEKYASFDTEVLSAWMSDIVQKDVDGKCVLTGKTIYQYNGGASIGFQSFSETKAVEVNVKGMNQSEEIIPTFKVKLKDQPKWQEKVMSADDEKALVSATPMYDIELVNVGKMNSYNTFDFSSGNTGAPNTGKGNVDGRLMDFGVGIRLKSVNSDKGKKGFYIPDKFDNWTFKLNTGVKENGKPSQQPLLWDYKENNRNTTGASGRDMTNGTNGGEYFAGTLPLTDSTKTTKDNYTTNNGGTWKFVQNADGTIDVTVSGASLYDENGNLVAPTHQGAGTAPLSPEPSQGNLYVSTAYFQLVVPTEKSSAENKKCELEITDTDMKVPYLDGQGNEQTATEQTVKDNDRVVKEYETLADGEFGLFHYLAKENQQSKFWGNNLSSNKSGMGLDAYALKGDTIQVVGAFSYDGDDIKDLNALNLLMKIDDKAIQPSASASNGTPTSNSLNPDATVRLLYAAKPGGVGWDSDDEMEAAREKDLEYFASMADLKAKYPNGVCVAVLAEARNVKKLSSAQATIGFNVDILDSAKEGTVYQVVHTAHFYKKDKNIGVNDTRLNNSNNPKLNSASAYIRNNNRYDKAEYGSEHNISNANSNYATYTRGASLLVVGVEAGIKKTVNSKSTSFDLSSGITYIPYKLQPYLDVADKKDGHTVTEMKITDILPKQLTVTNDTKYFYGDKEIIPTVEKLADGRTKLVFTLNNVPTGENLPSITFNAEIDFNEINLQEAKHTLQNTAQIEATGDGRTFSTKWASHPNQSSATATLVVNKSLNLSKQVLEPVLEVGQNIRYRVAFTNTQSLDYTNYKMLDVLPYNGDLNGSKFDGKYTTVAQLSAPSEIELYATTSEEIRGKDTSTLDMNLFSKITADSEENGFKHYVLPEGTTAILLKGTLPRLTQYVLNITLQPENNLGGNIYGNRAVMEADGLNKLTSALAKGEVVDRSLSGVAWLDVNKDGLIDKSERKLEGLIVNLYQINAITGDEELAKDIYGNPCTTKTNADGSYEFTNLTSGKYRVEFLDDNGNPVNLLDYDITQKNVGKYESINSKADAVLNVDSRMSSAQIADITLPTLDEMVKDNIRTYNKEHQNVGIYQPTLDKSVNKVWDDNNNPDRPKEVKVQLYADGKAVGNEITLNEANQWKHTFNDLAKYANGKEIAYTIKEVDVANGYKDKVEIGKDGNFTLTNTKGVVPPTGVTLNVKPYLLLVLMTLLIGGCGYYIKRKTRS